MSDAIRMLDAAIRDVDYDIRADMEDAEHTGEHVEAERYEVVLMYHEAQTIRATVIEQQAEIERLRELLGTVFSRHRAQIDEPLYTDIVMEIDQ